MPQISVIIPTHNGTTRFLDQALDSVFDQTYSDWELIIVDDASTDETPAYVQDRVHSCDRQVHYIQRSVNGGPSAARNDGARVAKGDFLAFLDQDDVWHPRFWKRPWHSYVTRHRMWELSIQIGGTFLRKGNDSGTSAATVCAFAIHELPQSFVREITQSLAWS